MVEYIKRETVINLLDACMGTIWKPEIAASKCFVEGIPAADVVPAMRCEECAYHEDEEPGMVYCPQILGGWVPNEFFCGDGKRRIDANEPNGALSAGASG